MPLFGRRPKGNAADAAGSRSSAAANHQRAAIAGFWSWWKAEGRALAAGSIAGEVTGDAVVQAMAPRVDAIDAGLAWELSPGPESEHVLTVTAAGAPELRAVARRWRIAAPPADRTWAYSDVRLPIGVERGAQLLQVGDASYDVSHASANAFVRGMSLDVSVHHPGFVDLPQEQRDVVTFLILDQVLGEEAVETWLGTVESSPVPALDPVPIAGLRSVVAQLKADHTGPDGTPQFALLQGSGPTGSPVLVLARIPLRAATAPHLDTYVAVAVPYADQTPEGLPGPGSLEALRALEDHVSGRLGGSGEIVAVQSHEGLRVLHLYVDGTTPAAEQVRVAVHGWDQGPVALEVHPDPAWDRVGHIRG